MAKQGEDAHQRGPGMVDNAISALNAWIGDHLAHTDNELQQPMAFYRDNLPIAPAEIQTPASGKICVLVHGLGCNESLWTFPAPHDGGDYGELFEERCGYTPLYLRFNTGLRVSQNGQQLADLLERLCTNQNGAVTEVLLVGHSMGGLVIRSACHVGAEDGQSWVPLVRHVMYLGSPHLGAPLERATNLATHALSFFNFTATGVVRDLLKTRSAGVKDLRHGNLIDRDWLDWDPETIGNRRHEPIPWLSTAHHHFVVGQASTRTGVFGDVMVGPESAAGRAHGSQPGTPDGSNVQVIPGLGHLALARHPMVFDHLERWVRHDG